MARHPGYGAAGFTELLCVSDCSCRVTGSLALTTGIPQTLTKQARLRQIEGAAPAGA